MFAKITFIFALVASLLFTSQALPVARPAAPRDPAACGEMMCAEGCCQSMACCDSAQQQRAPQSPQPLAPRPELQLAPIDFPVFALVCALPPAARDFIILHEASGGHSLPPLVASCIQLI